ncbi:MAG: aquaporin [Chloroflexota bacterium]|nr:aquaporin [Chloroflexota bacterium]
MSVRTFPPRKEGESKVESRKPAVIPTADHPDRPEQEPEEEPSHIRCLFAECFGTAALTTVAAGGEVIASISNGEVSHDAQAIAPGLLVMALIYALGDVSGAHVNPAVTLAFALRRDFPWWKVPLYWIAQIAGALGAAGCLRALFGTVAHLGANQPRHGVGVSLVMEILLSWLLITVILGTATRNRLIGPNAAIAVGGTIALCGLFAAPISGASMNPARSLGPALVGGTTGHLWIYIVGPVAGSILAVVGTWIIHGGRKPMERDAATGDDGKE